MYESQLRRTTAGLGSELDLSEQRLVSCHSSSCDGNTIDSGLDILIGEGAVDDARDPFRAEDDPAWYPALCSGSPPIHAFDFGLAAPPRTVCSSLYDHRDDAWSGEVMEALAMNGPLVAAMSVQEDDFYNGRGIYRTSEFIDSSSELGCREVALVGYSQTGRYWLIKNCWDEDGYAGIIWDDEHTQAGRMLYRLALGSPSPSPTATAATIAWPSPTTTVVASPRTATPAPIQPPKAASTWTATPLPPPKALTPSPSSTSGPYP